jgi:hypothetical protein
MAAQIAQLMDKRITSIDVTRPTADGGRDAVGQYSLGHGVDDIKTEFALEAKCYKPGSPVGVKETSRLISRLRYRQFGILVTTSFVGEQAYNEIREDRHPVIIISGKDLVSILKEAGYGTISDVVNWLKSNFPKP